MAIYILTPATVADLSAMSGHSNIHPTSEGTNRDSGGADRYPNKTLADTQLPQQFEFDQDELEDHESDSFFYELDYTEASCRLEMMKELEKRRVWAQHHQLSEEHGEDDGGEEEEGMKVSFNRSQISNNSHYRTDPHRMSN